MIFSFQPIPVIPDCHGSEYVAVRVERRVRLGVDQVRDVRDHAPCRAARPSPCRSSSPRKRSLSVRTMMSRSIAVALRERALDLAEELGVVVDVLEVVDLDARLRRELRRASGRFLSSRRSRCRAASSRTEHVALTSPLEPARRSPPPPQAASKPGQARAARRRRRRAARAARRVERDWSCRCLLSSVHDERGFGPPADSVTGLRAPARSSAGLGVLVRTR